MTSPGEGGWSGLQEGILVRNQAVRRGVMSEDTGEEGTANGPSAGSMGRWAGLTGDSPRRWAGQSRLYPGSPGESPDGVLGRR